MPYNETYQNTPESYDLYMQSKRYKGVTIQQFVVMLRLVFISRRWYKHVRRLMMMKKNRLLGLLAIPMSLLILLAGCSSSSGSASVETTTAESAEITTSATTAADTTAATTAATTAVTTAATTTSAKTTAKPAVTTAKAAAAATTAVPKAEPASLTISCAASLTEVMEAIKTAYVNVNPNVTITYNFGSSGSLQTQIENGAAVDVFFSAATSNMDKLATAGLLLDGTRKDVVGNTIVLVVPKDRATLSSIDDLATDAVTSVTIGEIESVPAGKYANQILTSLGLKDKIATKLIQGKDVKEVLTWVETGNAAAGFVFSTDAKSSDKVKIGCEIPANVMPKISYPAAVIKASKNAEAAKAFVSFLTTPEAMNIFTSYGFSTAS